MRLCQCACVAINSTLIMNWQYEPAPDLDQSLIDRLRCFPRQPDLSVYALRSAAALLLRGWLQMYHRLDIIGREHLPLDRSFVMVANHASHLDTLCLLSALPLRSLHRAFPAAAQDYFFENMPRLAIASVVVNAFPFGRQKNVRHSLEIARHLLANPGNILILFPEGTRTTTRRMSLFKPGIGMLVAGSDLPVVPCHLEGCFHAWPKGASVPRPRKLRLRIGAPRNYGNIPPGKEAAERIAADLHSAVADLEERP